MSSDEFIVNEEGDGDGTSEEYPVNGANKRTFLIIASVLTGTLLLLSLWAVSLLLTNQTESRTQQIAAIETQNVVILATNDAVTRTITAMEAETGAEEATLEPGSTQNPTAGIEEEGEATVVVQGGAAGAVETPIGTDVTVATGGATVTFATVTSEGLTTVEPLASAPALPDGYLSSGALYHDVSTTATYTAPVSVCFGYSPGTLAEPVRLLHYGGSGWVDITTSSDPDVGQVCGQTGSLSPFAVASGMAGEEPAATADIASTDGSTPEADSTVVAAITEAASGASPAPPDEATQPAATVEVSATQEVTAAATEVAGAATSAPEASPEAASTASSTAAATTEVAGAATSAPEVTSEVGATVAASATEATGSAATPASTQAPATTTSTPTVTPIPAVTSTPVETVVLTVVVIGVTEEPTESGASATPDTSGTTATATPVGTMTATGTATPTPAPFGGGGDESGGGGPETPAATAEAGAYPSVPTTPAPESGYPDAVTPTPIAVEDPGQQATPIGGMTETPVGGATPSQPGTPTVTVAAATATPTGAPATVTQPFTPTTQPDPAQTGTTQPTGTVTATAVVTTVATVAVTAMPTATVVPTPPSTLPQTGLNAWGIAAIGLGLILVVFAARRLRRA